MAKRLRKDFQRTLMMNGPVCCVSSVENFKRSRAAAPFCLVDANSKLFFEKILSVKKHDEIVFITSSKSRERL